MSTPVVLSAVFAFALFWAAALRALYLLQSIRDELRAFRKQEANTEYIIT